MEWLVVGLIFVIIVTWIYLYGKIMSGRQAKEIRRKAALKQGQRVCIFCGGTPLSKQHVWPNWFSKVVPREGNSRSRIKRGISFFSEDEPEYSKTQKKQGHPGTQKLLIVCTKCNNTWMSRIEDELISILTPLMLNKHIILSTYNQTLIAKWAVLSTIIAEYDDEPRRAIPEEDREFFYEERQPPLGWKIWIGRKDEQILNYHYAHISALAIDTANPNPVPPPVERFNVQFSVFAIGGFVLFTARNPLERIDHFFEDTMGRKMQQIYPPIRSSIDVSKLDVLQADEIADLHRYFIKKDMRVPQKINKNK